MYINMHFASKELSYNYDPMPFNNIYYQHLKCYNYMEFLVIAGDAKVLVSESVEV